MMGGEGRVIMGMIMVRVLMVMIGAKSDNGIKWSDDEDGDADDDVNVNHTSVW